MNVEPLVIVGIGQDGPAGLGPEARAHVACAQVLAGGQRHLAFFPEFVGIRITLGGDLPGWIERLKARDRKLKTVVLATGDPLFYGVGRVLLEAFSPAELRFVPHVSSVALAFAALKETWHDACVVSVHGRPLTKLLPALERRERKIAIFTDVDNHPAAIARLLCEQGLGSDYVLCVCENLGGDEERITRWAPADLTEANFAPLNLVVLLAESEACHQPEAQATGQAARQNWSHASQAELPLLGLPEAALQHRGGAERGLITKRAVRVQAICELELHPGDVLWDVGAGSGSVAIEAARLAPSLDVYAIEKAPEQLRENLQRFDLTNIHLIDGIAPEVLADLPNPDAVFVGGSGGRLTAILEHATHRLNSGGRLVVSCIAIETLSHTWNWLSERGLQPQATSLQLAHSRPLGSLHCLEPEHPIFLLRAKKP
jgi:precorrin-6Y C5,15-methyltransferase (decarboxylating)